MHPQVTVSRDGVVIAQGYGLKIYVERRHLVVHDGICDERHTRRYHRVTSKLRRLVVVGRTGFVTLEALGWLHDSRVALLHINADGELLATSVATGPDLAALRRAQALAATSDVGLEIARAVLTEKVAGQRAVLDELPHTPDTRTLIDRWLTEIASAATLQDLLFAESQAADVYWQAWSPLPVAFSARGGARVPEHWRTFGQRGSLLSGGPRLATNPAGAILNYLYALLEAETVLACHAVGLDPGLGIFHTDRRDRASLALDLMEAVRPLVDSYVLALITQRTMAASDFVETRQGACRLQPRLARELAMTLSAWRRRTAPVVERSAHALAESSPARLPLLTPLTRANQRAAWDSRSPGRGLRQTRDGHLSLPSSCRDCGAPLEDRRRRYCQDCRRVQSATHAAKARCSAATVLAQLRAEQRDPAHGGRAGEIRGAKNAAHQRAVAGWDGERPDPAVFSTEILPGLRRLPVSELITATGLGQHYCSLIRLGKRVPHARHWPAFRKLSGSAGSR
ncbi:MAG TPA: CRISPR-associated endonuclease Cas1 [Solirubrobacteraceae bacterium]|jgi:CRISPR-associated endonuclease Cas1|nr:CRISPR-associated endonuclease Cas1 [Solirubrobacteraceae bacterium]